MKYDTLRAILKKHGHSLTRPRKLVYDLLDGQEPQSMQVLARRAADRADRSTVYRTVDLYEQLGIVHRLNVGWKYKIELSDAFSEHHHHLHCTNCGATLPLPANNMLETMINTVAVKEDFSPRSHQLEIYGQCPNCR